MIRRLLNNKPSIPLNDQRENIFHTRCEVLKNICSSIIDSGSCCNCCSTRLVEKLNLTLLPHPKSYKLHWHNEDGVLKVEHQVKVKFSIGKFKDKVLCDVIPIEACHILLGRPWQFDHKTLHNGHTNEITLQHHSKTLCCIPSLLAKLLVIKSKCKLGERKRVPRTLMLLKILRTRQR